MVDADWRIVRMRIDTGAHQALLEPTGDEHLDYLTPATNLITTKRLTGTTELDVVFIEPFTLERVRDRQRYELHGPEVVRDSRRPVRRRPMDVHIAWSAAGRATCG